MKQVLLVRHAKSSWDEPGVPDIDRPLNERGKRDAPVMAHRMLDKKIAIDAFVTSPARRAQKTAGIFAKTFKADKDKLIVKAELYGAGDAGFFDVIHHLDEKLDSVAIFSHNPGLTDFANTLTETRIDNIPTSGVFAVRSDCKKWEDFQGSKIEFLFFDYPKAES
ncbi:MAG TPA: histidine phosphatase family protein [Chitinophagaceae bacterium]|nr:histidine phosphatase family protein [Chitinophagaceae bacterium]